LLLLAGAGSKTGENPQERSKFLLERLKRQFTHSGITPMGYSLDRKQTLTINKCNFLTSILTRLGYTSNSGKSIYASSTQVLS
jgi:hypothetical protein